MSEPVYLTLAEVLEIHGDLVERFGGAPEVRNMGLLESAVAMPQASFGGHDFHSNLFEMAAAYAFHIAENQPFVDGNKRAALASALVFLELNDVALEDPEGLLYDAMMRMAKRKLDKRGLAKLLEELAH